MGRPECPVHPGSKVWFDGTSGKPGHERQRFKCVANGNGRVHVFTEPLPRQQAAAGSCDHCERPVHRHEAPQTPRKFEYAARDIAAALLRVGRG
jgi:hypothetical protein